MLSQEMLFSEERQTWNLFVNGEWYLEGTYEQCDEAMLNNAICDAEAEVTVYDPDDLPGIDVDEEPDFSEVQDTSILWGAPEDAGAFGGGKY